MEKSIAEANSFIDSMSAQGVDPSFLGD